MKKIFILIVLSGCFCQLKAQQKLPFKGTDSLLYKLNKGDLKSGDPFKFMQPRTNNHDGLNQLLANNFGGNIDHMPVAVLEGNSKMPVKKLGGYYTMPVKRVGGEALRPLNQNTPPGLPTFKTP